MAEEEGGEHTRAHIGVSGSGGGELLRGEAGGRKGSWPKRETMSLQGHRGGRPCREQAYRDAASHQ
jgi:hypothetical protein